MDKITFIIPTIGRTTLKRSILSIINQTVKEWNAIIVFDGLEPNIDDIQIKSDSRIKIVKTPKKQGKNINSAGLVRNYGMKMVETQWIAFLDDDDTISNDYIETFHKELDINKDFDVLIFRMQMEDRIVPKLSSTNFKICDVGISFVMKREIFRKGLSFIANGAEDFLYLNSIRKAEYRIIISPYVRYFVRKDCEYNREFGRRGLINMDSPIITLLGYMMIRDKN